MVFLPFEEARLSLVCLPSTAAHRGESRFTEEQIIGLLRQAVAGMPVKELFRQGGFSDATFYKWRAKYGGMQATNAKRLRELESENAKLKRLLAEAHLDMHALKYVLGVKPYP